MQVNHSPSFGVDTPFDLALKTKLMVETLALVSADTQLALTIDSRTLLLRPDLGMLRKMCRVNLASAQRGVCDILLHAQLSRNIHADSDKHSPA